MRRSGEFGGALMIILIVVGVLALLVVGCFFIVNASFDVVAEQIKNEVRDNPVILEHIGNITEIDLELMKSGATGGDQDFVFNLTGSKGSGEMTATLNDDMTKVLAGSLRMSTGETFDLFPGAVPVETGPQPNVPKPEVPKPDVPKPDDDK